MESLALKQKPSRDGFLTVACGWVGNPAILDAVVERADYSMKTRSAITQRVTTS
jgi:hypothetical protein